MLYWVNWIYTHDGKACHGFWSEGEITLERAVKGVEWLKANTENLVCAWVNRSGEQPDGSHKNTGTPYMEVFVDAFGYPSLQVMKVVDECGEPKEPIIHSETAERPYPASFCPECGHILMDEYNDNFNFCPDCGQRIKWD